MHQQFESPASVVATVRRIWKPTFDAMATPFSAVCGAYATLEDDVLARAVIPPGAIVYANPAYAPQDMANGAAGLEVHLRKLVEVDVRARGCTLVALLPILSHTRWYESLVGEGAHEVHYIRGGLVFPNPFTDVNQRKKGYLWECRSYALCVWRPGAPPPQPRQAWLTLDAVGEERVQLRICRECGRVRVLPRWADGSSAALSPQSFVCGATPGCCVRRYVKRWPSRVGSRVRALWSRRYGWTRSRPSSWTLMRRGVYTARVYRTRRVYTNYQKCKPTAATLTSRHISLFLSRDSVVASQQRAAMYGDTKVQVRSPSAAALTVNCASAATLANVGCRMEHWVVARSEQSHAASTGRQRPPWPRRRRRRLAHSTREPRMRCRRMERRVSCLARRTGCAAAATTCACAALCASRPAAPARVGRGRECGRSHGAHTTRRSDQRTIVLARWPHVGR